MEHGTSICNENAFKLFKMLSVNWIYFDCKITNCYVFTLNMHVVWQWECVNSNRLSPNIKLMSLKTQHLTRMCPFLSSFEQYHCNCNKLHLNDNNSSAVFRNFSLKALSFHWILCVIKFFNSHNFIPTMGLKINVEFLFCHTQLSSFTHHSIIILKFYCTKWEKNRQRIENLSVRCWWHNSLKPLNVEKFSA